MYRTDDIVSFEDDYITYLQGQVEKHGSIGGTGLSPIVNAKHTAKLGPYKALEDKYYPGQRPQPVCINIYPETLGIFMPKPEPNPEHMKLLGNLVPPDGSRTIRLPEDADTGTGHAYPAGTICTVVWENQTKMLVRPDDMFPLRFIALDKKDI